LLFSKKIRIFECLLSLQHTGNQFMTYYYGVGIIAAFLLGIIRVTLILSTIKSIKAKNFGRIGLHLNFMNGNFSSERPIKLLNLGLYITYILLIAPLFSWLSVFSTLLSILLAKIQHVSPPEKIKEINFRISHVNLDKSEMEKIQSEMASIMGYDYPNDDLHILNLDDGEWGDEYKIDTKNKTVQRDAHTPDYDGIFIWKYEYRIIERTASWRLIEHSSQHYNEKYFSVKDNVVLESQIKSFSSDKLSTSLAEEIEYYKNEINWNAIKNYQVNFFIISKHPEIVSSFEFKSLLRSDLERLNNGLSNLIVQVEESGAKIEENEEGTLIRYPDEASPEIKSSIDKIMTDDNLSNFAINHDEIRNCKLKSKFILNLLGENIV